MTSADRSSLLPLLHARREAIADRWYTTIARTSFTPRRATDVRAELLALTDQVIALLVREPFDRAAARDIGAALARLHYVHADALAGTLDVLGQQLVAGLPANQTLALHDTLTALLGAVAAGFFAQSRAMILDEQDQIRRALFVTRQQAEVAEEARARAEADVRIRTDVLNAAAHDLRAPVTTIMGHADLLRMRLERDPPPAADWLRAEAAAMRAGAVRIRTMVEELLDVARLQKGQALDLQIESVDVGALVQDVARPRTTSAHGAAAVMVDAIPGLVVEGDRARLERVVDNLLGNAIKYSPGGTPIHVEVRPGEDEVIVVVRDQGVGIPVGELPYLFTPFYRASTARGIPGIGIGLAGAKTIVEQHGGHITVESAVGQGTTVTITLPSESSVDETKAESRH